MASGNSIKVLLFTGVVLVALGFLPVFGFADVVDELKSKINERESEIEALEEEIASYERELTEISKEKASLNGEIRRIDLTRRKLAADIRLTQENINSAEWNIDRLSAEIGDTGAGIIEKTKVVKKAIRRMNEIDDLSLAEMVLASVNISTFWNDVEEIERFQNKLNEEVAKLSSLKNDLESRKERVEAEQARLTRLRGELSAQKQIADNNKQDKERLLEQTQNEEASYENLLAEKRAQKRAFEQELFDLESELQATIDPGSLPSPGSGVLRWPLDDVTVTQHFGNTRFAKSGAYSGQGHNGVDFRASVGTPVRAALSGRVVGTGDTDKLVAGSKVRVAGSFANVRGGPYGTRLGAQPRGARGMVVDGPVGKGGYTWWKVDFSSGVDGWVAQALIQNRCYSYGKWVLVEHNNNLSTLYAHLSLIDVAEEEPVITGEAVGYSGNTGYSTGPHLHFTTYASAGVEVVRLGDVKQNTNCPQASIPVAPFNAYLNPLDYL